MGGKAGIDRSVRLLDPDKVLEASPDLGEAMPGLEISKIPAEQLLDGRGW